MSMPLLVVVVVLTLEGASISMDGVDFMFIEEWRDGDMEAILSWLVYPS